MSQGGIRHSFYEIYRLQQPPTNNKQALGVSAGLEHKKIHYHIHELIIIDIIPTDHSMIGILIIFTDTSKSRFIHVLHFLSRAAIDCLRKL